jgi:hypothetical protein
VKVSLASIIVFILRSACSARLHGNIFKCVVQGVMAVLSLAIAVLHARRPAVRLTRSGCLNGPQIQPEGAGIFAAEVKRRHVRMVTHQALSQAVHESIEVHTATKLAERRSTGVRALALAADSMALRAHVLGQRAALLFQWAGSELLGESGGGAEKQNSNGKSDDHFDAGRRVFCRSQLRSSDLDQIENC